MALKTSCKLLQIIRRRTSNRRNFKQSSVLASEGKPTVKTPSLHFETPGQTMRPLWLIPVKNRIIIKVDKTCGAALKDVVAVGLILDILLDVIAGAKIICCGQHWETTLSGVGGTAHGQVLGLDSLRRRPLAWVCVRDCDNYKSWTDRAHGWWPEDQQQQQ